MFLGNLRELRHGRLQMALEFHIPYQFFRAVFSAGKDSQPLIMALDAVTGKLDPYNFDEMPAEEFLVQVDTPNFIEPRIDKQGALKHFEQMLFRSRLLKGAFKISNVKINAEYVTTYYIPYWVGVYERRDQARIEVIDALRGRMEGRKIRDMVTEWFRPRSG
jgi:hypothetical protein